MRLSKTIGLAAALPLLALFGCAANGTLTSAASSDLTTALALACPLLDSLQGANLNLNAYQKAALKSLQTACPPNPPPDSLAVAAADIVSAYEILLPLLNH